MIKIIEPIGVFGQDIFLYLLPKVTSATHIDDFAINLFILVFILSYIVFYFTVKFAPVFSHVKVSLLMAFGFSGMASILVYDHMDKGTAIPFDNYTMAAGELWLWAIIIYAAYLIFSNAYYENLFGRFRNRT